MQELAWVVLSLAGTTGLAYAILRRDLTGRKKRGLDHPWNAATFGCAVWFFQLLAVPAYYWAARRRGAAVAWLVVLVGVYAGLALLPIDTP